jgi:hypothetical protein
MKSKPPVGLYTRPHRVATLGTHFEKARVIFPMLERFSGFKLKQRLGAFARVMCFTQA